MSPFKKARLYRLGILRGVVTAVVAWDRTWGTPEQSLPPDAMDVLHQMGSMSSTNNLFLAGSTLRLVLDHVRRRQQKRPNFDAAFEVFRRQMMQRYDTAAFEALTNREETQALREELRVLSGRVDRLGPKAALA